MNNFLIGVIAMIAAIFAAILFGRPKGKTDDAPTSITQVEQPSLPTDETTPVTMLPPPISDEPVATATAADAASTEPSKAVTIHEEIVDPWAELSEVNAAASPATEPTEVPAVRPPTATPTTPATTAPEATAATSTPTVASRSMPPFAAIHDPKRPSTPALQDLSQEIVNMGSSGKLSYIPKLIQYRQHEDPLIRCYVVHAIGEIAAAHGVTKEIQAAIPILGEMTNDPELQVREMAFKALSRIQSPDVQPYLEKGLLSPSSSVKQLANAALQKLKLQYGNAASAPEYPPALQKRPDQM